MAFINEETPDKERFLNIRILEMPCECDFSFFECNRRQLQINVQMQIDNKN